MSADQWRYRIRIGCHLDNQVTRLQAAFLAGAAFLDVEDQNTFGPGIELVAPAQLVVQSIGQPARASRVAWAACSFERPCSRAAAAVAPNPPASEVGRNPPWARRRL